jgi:hypothetical protein
VSGITIDPATGTILIEKDGRVAFANSRPLMNLVPSAAITLNGYSISFPDLWKGTIYHQVRQPSIPSDQFGCSTWIGLVEQEWGPDQPAPNTLPDITLGTVPAGTDYLDVRINLTRTVVPANIFDLGIRSQIPEGHWVKLEGGSCMIEGWSALRRLFEIRLSGTSVILRRRQSVTSDGVYMRIPGGQSQGTKVFYFPGPNAPEDINKLASYGQIIQQLGWDQNDTHRPAGYEAGSLVNTPCSMSHAGISYASTWTGSIHITPGRIGA